MVAVHGLGGDPYGTWAHESPTGAKVLWLNELLVEQDRPIIFIGHNIGGAHHQAGLLCNSMPCNPFTNNAQALVFAAREIPNISKMTRDIVFFGTLHFGVKLPSWPVFSKLAAAWARRLHKETFSRVLSEIQPNSHTLIRLSDDFYPLQDRCAICSLFEGQATPVLGMVSDVLLLKIPLGIELFWIYVA